MTATELKARRLSLGLTQEQLAQALGVSFSTVNRWESAKDKTSRKIPNYLTLALDTLERGQLRKEAK